MAPRLPPIGRFGSTDWVEATGSTNDDLAARVRGGDREPAVLLTEEQLAGRGRRDRSWHMPRAGGLLLSVFVPWSAEPTVSLVPMALSLAARETIVATGRDVAIKWPNDLIAADGRKVGGMLGEVIRVDGELVGAVVGLGCNVTWPKPDEAAPPNAAALDPLGSTPLDREALARGLITRFDRLLDDLEDFDGRGAAAVLDAYRAACATIGQMVRVESDAETFEGRARDLDPTGALVVEVAGEPRVVTVGDLVHLRPAQSDPG